MTNKPDKWIVLKMISDVTNYKVFATYYGGYLNGDSWKTNNGIVKVEESDNYFDFIGHSGSVYSCQKGENNYGTNSYSQSVLESIQNGAKIRGYKIEVMDVNTNWKKLNYDSKQ